MKCHNGGHFLLRVGGRERPFPHARWLTPPPHPHRRGTDLCRIESDNIPRLKKEWQIGRASESIFVLNGSRRFFLTCVMHIFVGNVCVVCF